MLIKDEIIEKIRSGEITVLFRRWSRPGAKAGGTQMTQGGVVGIDAVDIVEPDEITDLDAREAGYSSVSELLEHLAYRTDPIYRLRVYWIGEDPRIALRENAKLSEDEVAELLSKLAKMDRASKSGEWTLTFLTLINEFPATYSGRLAKKVGMEIPKFKPMVRRLKSLGLTESLEVGYRLSPRGERVLSELSEPTG
jgi:hypothetical protein